MLDMDLPSLKEADLELRRDLDFHKRVQALVTEHISGPGVSLSYVVVALCTRPE
jgi:hypothetical protein